MSQMPRRKSRKPAWLKALRREVREQGLRQQDFARPLKLTPSAISHRFTNRTEFSVTEFLKVCDKADINPCEVLRGE
jgi:predicted transcriptional regulator